MKKTIESAAELMEMTSEITARMVAGKIPVEMAQAIIRGCNTLNSTFALRLEHARLTGRLERNSDVLPDTQFNPTAKPSTKPTKTLTAKKKLPLTTAEKEQKRKEMILRNREALIG